MRRILQITVLSLSVACCLPALAWQNITVKKADTLDSIAAKYHPAGVSTMDMVIAIRNANPSLVAHGLRSNMSLRIPTTVAEVRQSITNKKLPKASPAKAAPVKTTGVKTAVVKQSASAKDPALLAQIAADKATIANLQQSINSQIQTIQTYQTQITDLTAKLAMANQTVSAAAQSAKTAASWSIGDLFLPIWLITLVLYLRMRRRLKGGALVPAATAATAAPLAPCEPNFVGGGGAASVTEPDLLKEAGTEWQQVELDIPESDVPLQTHIPLEPLLTSEEKEELVGEQQNIINAISNDHDNIDWHMALLEFYTKTNNESGYQRHYQNMLRSGLMQEGDSLWETVRKLYLNRWIYRTEGV